MIPFKDQSTFVTSWIHLGTASVTTRGIKENDMEKIAHCINETLTHKNDLSRIKMIKKSQRLNEILLFV
ncbi:MAG: hypothetical protein ACMUEM_04125 [Flavobacteriales bacterium AspAUS03]